MRSRQQVLLQFASLPFSRLNQSSSALVKQSQQIGNHLNKQPIRNKSKNTAKKMLSNFWRLDDDYRALSLVDPFRLSWPDEFDRMARRLEEDMWRRDAILNDMQESMWKDYMLFFNNPERASIDSEAFNRALSTSTEHFQAGKVHTFKRSVTVNGKTDTVTAVYDGEKTTVKYGGDKEVVLPGLYDITVDVAKRGTKGTAELEDKLESMNRKLRGEPAQKQLQQAEQSLTKELPKEAEGQHEMNKQREGEQRPERMAPQTS